MINTFNFKVDYNNNNYLLFNRIDELRYSNFSIIHFCNISVDSMNDHEGIDDRLYSMKNIDQKIKTSNYNLIWIFRQIIPL